MTVHVWVQFHVSQGTALKNPGPMACILSNQFVNRSFDSHKQVVFMRTAIPVMMVNSRAWHLFEFSVNFDGLVSMFDIVGNI